MKNLNLILDKKSRKFSVFCQKFSACGGCVGLFQCILENRHYVDENPGLIFSHLTRRPEYVVCKSNLLL